MRTTLSPEEIAAVHADATYRVSQFVDPCSIARCLKILAERGEAWAESVLLRKITWRSLLHPDLPWLNDGDVEILVLADESELEQLWKS